MFGQEVKRLRIDVLVVLQSRATLKSIMSAQQSLVYTKSPRDVTTLQRRPPALAEALHDAKRRAAVQPWQENASFCEQMISSGTSNDQQVQQVSKAAPSVIRNDLNGRHGQAHRKGPAESEAPHALLRLRSLTNSISRNSERTLRSSTISIVATMILTPAVLFWTPQFPTTTHPLDTNIYISNALVPQSSTDISWKAHPCERCAPLSPSHQSIQARVTPFT